LAVVEVVLLMQQLAEKMLVVLVALEAGLVQMEMAQFLVVLELQVKVLLEELVFQILLHGAMAVVGAVLVLLEVMEFLGLELMFRLLVALEQLHPYQALPLLTLAVEVGLDTQVLVALVALVVVVLVVLVLHQVQSQRLQALLIVAAGVVVRQLLNQGHLAVLVS
jgi:hypothetical protein